LCSLFTLFLSETYHHFFATLYLPSLSPGKVFQFAANCIEGISHCYGEVFVRFASNDKLCPRDSQVNMNIIQYPFIPMAMESFDHNSAAHDSVI
jgi:hypothetical protein